MARLKRFVHALASGYGLMAANMVYTLTSVPLALVYLSRAEFGLWVLVVQLSGYLALLDLGMSVAGMRILIDHKDRIDDGDYGSVILTGVWVNVVQGVLILLAGAALAWGMGPVLRLPGELIEPFRWLVMGQSALLAGGLVSRVASMILTAHQRYDVANYWQSAQFAVSLGVLWACFHGGVGIYSVLWAQAVSLVAGSIAMGLSCRRLRLLPQPGRWGHASVARFKDLFRYGRDMFLYSAGYQLIHASQTVLITRLLGLEEATIWSVCTRAFALATQMICKIFDYSCAALAEMIVRGERERLFDRFRSVIMVSGSLSVLAGVGFAAANGPFVALWTSGRIQWPAWNDWLLACWLPVLVLVRSHTGLVGLLKAFGFMRYLYFLEGLVFVALALAVLGKGSMTAMILASLASSLAISFPYGVWRTSIHFGIPARRILCSWLWPCARLAMVLVPAGVLVTWWTARWAPWERLLVMGVVLGAGGLLALLRWGLDDGMKSNLRAAWPRSLKGLDRVLGARPESP